MTIPMYIATTAWLLLVAGYFKRKERSLHVLLMRLGIGIDIGLVLFLQVTRSAIQTAASFKLSMLEQVHIGFSTLAFVLYFPVMYLGWKLLKGSDSPSTLIWHKRLALSAFAFRTLGFLFMFSMWKS